MKKDNIRYILIYHALLYIGLTCLSAVLAALMATHCKAETFTKSWTVDTPREGLTIGLDKGNFLFEISFEYEEGERQTFAAPMAFSYLHDTQYGDFTLTFGGGVGFQLELYWTSNNYDIIGHDITYPDIETDTFLFAQTYVSASWDVLIVVYKMRVSDSWILPSLEVGFTW